MYAMSLVKHMSLWHLVYHLVHFAELLHTHWVFLAVHILSSPLPSPILTSLLHPQSTPHILSYRVFYHLLLFIGLGV